MPELQFWLNTVRDKGRGAWRGYLPQLKYEQSTPPDSSKFPFLEVCCASCLADCDVDSLVQELGNGDKIHSSFRTVSNACNADWNILALKVTLELNHSNTY